MVCRGVKVGTANAIVCSRPAQRKCQHCNRRRATLLCDFPDPEKPGTTCDARLCPRCAVLVAPDRHYCPDHGVGPAQGRLEV